MRQVIFCHALGYTEAEREEREGMGPLKMERTKGTVSRENVSTTSPEMRQIRIKSKTKRTAKVFD